MFLIDNQAMHSYGQTNVEHYPDGKSLYVWKADYEKDPDVEKFLGQHGAGWKIHLNVPPDKNNEFTNQIACFLNDHPYVSMYKIGAGGEEITASGMTIYAGSWDRVAAVAHALHEAFGDSPLLGKAAAENDIRLVGEILARFDAYRYGTPNADFTYAKYGPARGLSGFSEFAHDFGMPVSPEHCLTIGIVTLNKYTQDFGDYLWGQGGTAQFRQRGLAGLPLWAQYWCRDRDVPFGIEAAMPTRAQTALFGADFRHPNLKFDGPR